MVGLLVGVDGNISGAGMNPVRWFGPAAAVAAWSVVWIYTDGPIVGSIGAALVRRSPLCRQRQPPTAQIVHDAG